MNRSARSMGSRPYHNRGMPFAVAYVAFALAAVACSSDTDNQRDAGLGSAGSAGATASGGGGAAGNPATTSSGGRSATGSGVAGRIGTGESGGRTGGAAGRGMDDDAGTTSGDPVAGRGGTTTELPPASDALVGWAAVSGDGVETTTGGASGRTVTAANAEELLELAEREEPLVIQLRGTYAVPRLNVASNKTLVGMNAGATIEGGIRIRGKKDAFVRNVIVKNLRLSAATSDVDGDGLQIHFAHHVWIDHCEIWDGPDGNLDIVHGSNWVTVSWTKFRYTETAPDAEHRFSNLIGHSDDNADEDTGRLKVTWHHNHWVERVIERMPRIRFGEVHVFNNYYTSTGNNYAIGAGLGARVRVENSVFEGVADPHIFYDGEATAQIVASGNRYTSTTGDRQMGQGNAFMAPYPYRLEDVGTVAASVRANAGPK